ncbi:rho GDP-dissociation inhibitor 1-like [Rhododendron vialii]|uniref:rho GDP-dissociation inhibitor 1-like n=1 Tax=Rhododendron vialii TaxID=182163 RepID=UPI00265DAE5B|nr:rho GDP-dissociation inhibitor 1-like [Rhododendron vialii]
MSLAIGVESSSSKSKSDMGFDENKEEGKKGKENQEGRKPEGAEEEEEVVETGGRIERKQSESSICDVTEDEDESDVEPKIELGPQFTIKQQLEKDKDDESLRKWKEQLLGSVDINAIGETLEPEVKILSLAIKSPGRPDIFLPVPESGNPKGLWFTLKEGSRYSLNFTFQVNNNIVSGLKYINTVWKTGVKVDSAKEMVGTFSPQLEPYTHEMPEETTPTGFFARGSYTAKTKFVDDDNKCYLEINYTFDIRKDWQEN